MPNPSNFDKRNQLDLEAEIAPIQAEHKSNTICSAKWLQSTVNLYNGTTHSCHHCPRHAIDIVALIDNPAALHNTATKAEERASMRAGNKPDACNYCWYAEEAGTISDRVLKTTNKEWSVQHLDRLHLDNPDPSYLEIAFDTTCNLKCLYCGPAVSSKWMEEVLQHGPFDTSTESHGLGLIYRNKELPIPNNQHNPFKDAFWQWWPSLKHSLKVFRITGGEPLMSKSTWRVLEDLQQNPAKDLTLVINSNFTTIPALFDRLLDHAKELESKLKSFQVTTSAECYGDQAEYIRHGLDYELFISNCFKFLNQTSNTKLTVTLTVNALSIFSMQAFLEDVYRLRKRFPRRVFISIAYLRHPDYMDVRVLNKDLTDGTLTLVKQYVEDYGSTVEVEQMTRLIEYAAKPIKDTGQRRSDLRVFLNEWDSRRGSDYRAVFPLLDNYLEGI